MSSPLCSVMVISYEMLLRSVEQVKELDFGVLICDEGHRLKNSNIKTAGALTALSCERRLILTGFLFQINTHSFVNKCSSITLCNCKKKKLQLLI